MDNKSRGNTQFRLPGSVRKAIDLSLIMSVTDTFGVIKSASQKFCEVSQYSEDVLIGKTHHIVNSGYHEPEFFRQMWLTIRAGKPWKGDIKNRAKDGSFFWVETEIVPVFRRHKIVAFMAVWVIITERKEMQKALIESEKRYRTLVENLPDKVALSKKDGQVIYANANYSNFFGNTQTQLIDNDSNPLAKQKIESNLQLDNLSPENPFVSTLLLMKNKDNHERYILWKEAGIFDEAGQLSELLSVGRDITPLKLSEEESKKNLKELLLIDNIKENSLGGLPYPVLLKQIFDVFDNYTIRNRGRLYGYNAQERTLHLIFDKAAKEIVEITGIDWSKTIPKIIPGDIFDDALEENMVITVNTIPEIVSRLFNAFNNKAITIDYSSVLRRLNIHGFAIIPLQSNGIIHGIITLPFESGITDDTKAVLQRLSHHFSAILSRSKMEEDIINQRKFTESVLNNIPADIAVFDENHKYVFVNKQAIKDEQIRKWIIGKDDFEYCRSRGKDIAVAIQRREYFNQAITGQGTEWVEDNITPTNEIKYILRKFFPYKEGEKLKYVIGYGIDITELKTAEAMKDRYIRQLEELAFDISHQVRSSIANILGIAKIVELDLSHQELKQVNGFLKQSINNLDTFTRQIGKKVNEYQEKFNDLSA
jgi:PAS domain S-box-containing protein